jgi:Amt family ammonium transporter
MLALLIVGGFTFGGSWILYKLTDLIIPTRVTSEQEEVGLDLSQHGETAFSIAEALTVSNGHTHTHTPAAEEVVGAGT